MLHGNTTTFPDAGKTQDKLPLEHADEWLDGCTHNRDKLVNSATNYSPVAIPTEQSTNKEINSLTTENNNSDSGWQKLPNPTEYPASRDLPPSQTENSPLTATDQLSRASPNPMTILRKPGTISTVPATQGEGEVYHGPITPEAVDVPNQDSLSRVKKDVFLSTTTFTKALTRQNFHEDTR